MIGGLPGVIAGGASGAEPVTLSIANASLSLGVNEQRGYGLLRDGSGFYVRTSTPGLTTGDFVAGEWVASGATATVGNGFEVIATLSSGTPGSVSQSFGVWMQIATLRRWTLGTPGSFTLRIRPFGGGADLVNATITVTA